MTTPTPKHASGATPGALAALSYSPAMLGGSFQSPAASHLLHAGRTRSPASTGLMNQFATPNTLAGYMREGGLGFGIAPDEAKKKEFEEVVRVLGGVGKGRISEEGVERVARALGMDVWRDSPQQKNAASVVTTFSLSGEIIVVDVDFTNGQITRTDCSFANTQGPMVDFAARAAKILQQNLTPLPTHPAAFINSDLTPFAENLQRLASLDKISSRSEMNCFEAIGGMYTSLERLYQAQKQGMGEDNALYMGFGKPAMHGADKIGLSIEYWRDKDLDTIIKKTKESSAMELDDDSRQHDASASTSYRLIVHAQEVPSGFPPPFPTLRQSSEWLPETEAMGPLKENNPIPWNEPPEAPPAEPSSARPNLLFQVRLEPPVWIPYEQEPEIYTPQTAHLPGYEPTMHDYTSLEKLLWDREEHEYEPVKHKDRVWVPHKEEWRYREWQYNKLKPLYLRKVTEVPFGHPRELGGLMAILRQAIAFQTLLKSALPPHDPTSTSSNSHNRSSSPESSSFPATSETDVPSTPPITVTASGIPHPLIRILVPSLKNPDSLNSIDLTILKNAEIQVKIGKDVYGDDEEEGNKMEVDENMSLQEREKRVARMAMTLGDLGWVVEGCRRVWGDV